MLSTREDRHLFAKDFARFLQAGSAFKTFKGFKR